MKLLHYSRILLQNISDWFYKPFAKYVSPQNFRYAFFGGSNVAFDTLLYFITFNFILQKHDLNIFFIAIKSHNAAFFLTFPVSFTTGFMLSKYITFNESIIRGRIQLFRYGLTVVACIVLNYLFIKFFVEIVGIFPTISKVMATLLVIIFSYFTQKYFTFQMHLSNDQTVD